MSSGVPILARLAKGGAKRASSLLRSPALVAAVALSAVPAAASAQEGDGRTFDGAYDVIVKGLDAGDFTYHFAENGGSYEVAAERRAGGMLRALVGARQDFQYSVKGAVEDGRLAPAHYRHTGGGKGRIVEVRFTPDEIVTTATPPMGMGNPPATAEQKRGAIDQLSAIANMIVAKGDLCARTVRVFLDGRSRFDFVMRPAGEVKIDEDGYKGPGIRCDVDYRPISGFSDPQEPAKLTFLFAPTASGMFAPVRIEMPTDEVGVITLKARRLTLNGVRLRK
jgi:hypothetical protein